MKPTTLRFQLTLLAAAIAFGASLGASAALTDVSQTPVATSSGNLVKPNISYVLDSSGSMAWSHAPDESQQWYNNVGYKTAQCNSIYYDPQQTYVPGRNYDGTVMANSSFTAAPKNGYSAFDGASTGTVNLSTSYYAYDNTSSFGAGTDTLQPAYYYNYVGSGGVMQQPTGLNYQNTSSQFYKECNLQESATPYSTITFSGANDTGVNSITVNGTNILSGPTASATSSSTLASLTQANVTASGYSATVSGSTVTINGPATVAGVVPVVNLSPPTTNSSITFSGTNLTSVTGITVNGVQIMSGGTAQTATSSTQAANVAAAISLNGFTATVSGSKVTIYGPASAAGYTPAVSMQGTQNSTITFAGSNSTIVTGVFVGGTNILGGPTSASSSSTTTATNTDAAVAASGYSATSSGSKVTVTGPASVAGITPTVTTVPGVMTATLTVSGSGATSVSGITVNGVAIMGSASSASSSNSGVATNVDAAISANGFTATSSGSVVTISGPGNIANGQTPVVTVSPGAPTATITFSVTSSTSITNVKVNGTTITSGATTATTSTSIQATNLAGKITLAGYTASASGSVVTITGPAGAMGFTPVVTKSGSMTAATTAFASATTMSLAASAFTGAAPISGTATAFVSNGTMSASTAAFPAPGTMTAAVVAFSPFVKVIVSATSGTGPSGADERQNFANWFTYYRIRMLMMKSGLGRAFVNIGSTYRVGFMTIYATPSSSTTDPGYLAISDFTAAQKQSWYTKVYSQTPGGGTPLKTALSVAARNIAGKVGPDPQQYSCQQNFILLSTDGYWNSGTPNGKKLDGTTDIGNQDGSAPAPQGDATAGGTGASNTLADVAYYYYNTDLRPGTGTCNTGVSGADVCTDNVPASTDGRDAAIWQHVTLFTLGLGTNGQLVYDDDYLHNGSADFTAIAGGTLNWPVPVGDTLTTIDDLWHAAVNGHGQYFSARTPTALVSGLTTALSGVNARLAAGAAAATSNLQPVNGDNFAYVGSYTTKDWVGDLQSHSIDLNNGAISTTPNWSASAILDAAVTATTDTRTIFTFLGGAKVDFLPASFSATQKTNWFTPGTAPVLAQYSGWTAAQITAGTADTVINYLRGQWGNDERGGNAQPLYRIRTHVLGDIIDSTPAYMRLPPFNYSENNYQTFKTSSTVTGRTGMVYVGANDGMLHAFDGTTGTEVWAYVPSFVLPNMKSLASDDYSTNHKFFVDGSATISDIWNGTAWKTILVSGLNAGGKGYFALDVTDPTNPAVLWEFSDANLGYSFGNPTINKLTDGTWVVSFTSGYNNVGDGLGRLYVVNAWTGVTKFTISTGVGSATSPSGLGKIAAWVDNGLVDNTVQRIYGGDLFGNLWRFDVNNQYPPSGQDAVLLANFTVGTYAQPITTAPQIALIGSKAMVYVGTGKYIGASDTSDLNQQSLYGILDQLSGTGLGNARTETTCPLVQQSITVVNASTRSTTTLGVDLTTKCGWFLDFNPSNGSPGERVNVDMSLQLGVLSVGTNVPEVSVCTSGGSSWLYNFDYTTGSFVATSTNTVAGVKAGNSLIVGLNVIQLPSGETINEVTGSDDSHTPYDRPKKTGGNLTGKRVMWRELLN